MDYKKAIEALLNEIGCVDLDTNNRGYIDESEQKFMDACNTAVSAMEELQAIHNNGIGLERLKDIDFRKQVVEHINYMDYMDTKDELEEYKKIGTLEEVREAVEKHNECKNCVYKIHSERISKLNNCNDCGLHNTCAKRPEYGDYCRINCYDWRKNE